MSTKISSAKNPSKCAKIKDKEPHTVRLFLCMLMILCRLIAGGQDLWYFYIEGMEIESPALPGLCLR